MTTDSHRIIALPIAEVRMHMVVKLTVAPRHLFRALWEPNGRLKEQYRDELVALLTQGWEGYTITRPAADHDAGRLIIR